ncbi:MAG: DUF6340 family protein [Cyanobacteriota bacterium]
MKKVFILFLFFFSLLSSCATYIKVKLLKPSEIYIGNIKNVSVSDFDLKGDFSSNEEKSLGEIAGNILVDAILGNKSKEDDFDQGKKASDKLSSKLNENAYFNVLSSNSDKNDAIIKGSGIYKVNDSAIWIDDIQERNGITIRNKKYKVSRKVSTFITYNVLDSKTNAVLATQSLESSNSDYQIVDLPDDAKHRLREWKSMADEQLTEIANKIALQISPHYEFEDREIKDGKSKMMKSALEYSKSGLMEEAKKIWEDVLNDTKSEKEDILNSNYNIAIYYEINGNFDKAIEYFNKCYKISNKNDFFNDISRINKRKEEIEKLKKSGAKVNI